MGNVYLAFCIYGENPYGNSAKLSDKKYRGLFTAALNFGRHMNDCFGNIPRTYACTGSHLEAFAKVAEEKEIREIYSPKHSDIANHTYSHLPLFPVKGIDGWYPRKILTSAETAEELRRTNQIIAEVLKKKSAGFSAPCGASTPLPQVLARVLHTAGCAYSHSYTRGRNGAFFAPLEETGKESKLRQPFRYSNGLWEIPLSGWQDVFNFPQWFRFLHKLRYGKTWPCTEHRILGWWKSFLGEAVAVSEHRDCNIYLTHMLHPAYLAGIPFIDRWGIRHTVRGYDPDLRILQTELAIAQDHGVKIVTLGRIAELLNGEQ